MFCLSIHWPMETWVVSTLNTGNTDVQGSVWMCFISLVQTLFNCLNICRYTTVLPHLAVHQSDDPILQMEKKGQC